MRFLLIAIVFLASLEVAAQEIGVACFESKDYDVLVDVFENPTEYSNDVLSQLESQFLNPRVKCLLEKDDSTIEDDLINGYFRVFESSRNHSSEMIPLGMGKLFYHFPEKIEELVKSSSHNQAQLLRDLEYGYNTYLTSIGEAKKASEVLDRMKRG